MRGLRHVIETLLEDATLAEQNDDETNLAEMATMCVLRRGENRRLRTRKSSEMC